MVSECGGVASLAEAEPLADHQAADQPGDAGVDVDHRAAGEVERSHVEQEAGVGLRIGQEIRPGEVPDHVRDREIDDRHPQHDEDDQRAELDPLGERPDDQRRRDAGEGHLEDDIGVFGNVDVVREGRGVGRRRHAHQHGLGQPAEELRRPGGERLRIAPAAPDDRDDRHDHEHLHQHAEHVLRPHQAAVEQREARHRHHQHEQGRDQHPGGVALVRHVGLLNRGRCLDQRRCGPGRRAQRRGRSGRSQRFPPEFHRRSSPLTARFHWFRRCGCGPRWQCRRRRSCRRRCCRCVPPSGSSRRPAPRHRRRRRPRS